MSCGTYMCEYCGHLSGVSWGDVSPMCPRCLGDVKRAKKKGILLPSHIVWLIRYSNGERLSEAIESSKKYPVEKEK